MGRKTMGEEFHESKIITQANSETRKTKMTIGGHNETTALLVYRTGIRIRQEDWKAQRLRPLVSSLRFSDSQRFGKAIMVVSEPF